MTKSNQFNVSRTRSVLTLALMGAVALFSASCGGGGGGSDGAGRGLVLLSFSESGVDNVVLNRRLEFRFSESVDPSTISNASIQLREGPSFGRSVFGTYQIQGSTVIFEPRLAALCDQSDSGFKPDTQYRVQLMGFPEQFAVRNESGQSLDNTRTYEFHTRLDSDPDKYNDQIPGVGPNVLSSSPANASEAVAIAAGNRIEIVMSENLNPCTVDATTVLVDIYEQGDPAVMATAPNGKLSGFSSDGTNTGSTADQLPGIYNTWGATGTTSFAGSPRRVLCDITLEQDFTSTKIVATPVFGLANGASKFPENVMIVVQLTFGISDFGNLPMTPTTFSFTTENLAPSSSNYLIANKGETAYIDAVTTAAVHPDTRAPERVQAYMLFAGDGDNGADQSKPSLPKDVSTACLFDLQPNSGTTDDFDPAADFIFDTGSVPNTCANSTDGSNAVIWEFNTFRIRGGITVRIVGVNPAIILVVGDAIIENGARLLAMADGGGGTGVTGRGANAKDRYESSSWNAKGGAGVAGGGNGGDSGTAAAGGASGGGWNYGQGGFSGYGSPDYDATMAVAGSGHEGEGAGEAGSPSGTAGSAYNPWDAGSAGGGGGGHSAVGLDGGTKQGSVYKHKLPTKSAGGGTFGDVDSKLLTPEGGAGGGSSGAGTVATFQTSTNYSASGGGGGAGGGFVDLTSSGDILINGGIWATGGRGGNGDQFSAYGASAGAGGGSGGAIRILTPNDIVLTGTAVLSTAGGSGGTGVNPYSNPNGRNDGGAGGTGRICLEDGDSVISGLLTASVTPAEGAIGFYRGSFNASRFQGGGLKPRAVTELVPIGNHEGFDPTFNEPVASDFLVGVPVAGSPGLGNTAILIEVSGVQMKADGTADLGTATPFFSVGHFTDNGVENAPDWNFGHPPIAEVPFPIDNAGAGSEGFTALNAAAAGNGFEFLQVRFSFFLPTTVGPFDPGAYVDDWTIHFTHDN